jgi:H+/gluconate symporter-like permease
MLAVNLAITIGLVIFLIMVFKINAVISLILGSLYMGISSGLGLLETASGIASGFGSFMSSIGIPIIFGIMIGQLLADSGGARSIASTLVKNVGKKRIPYAIGLAGAILAIPVFFDVVFVILAPLAVAIYKETQDLKYPAIIGSLVIGANGAHVFIPPTPAPLASASILNFPLAHLMGFGLTVGILIILFSIWLYVNFIVDKIWNDEKDIKEIPFEEHVESETMPGFGVSLIPIAVPKY